MTQALHILRKDLRHLLPEIAASLGILVLFVLTEPRTWSTDYGTTTGASQAVAALLFLLATSWAVLTLRLVHTERLVGLNQFWTTRPYRWPSLLAAKGLFLALTVYVPLALAQLYLLHAGGFAVSPNLPHLVLNLVLITAAFPVPFACIAIVTRSFAQAVLVLLAGLAALVGIVIAITSFGLFQTSINIARTPELLTPIQMAFELVLFAAAILLQFARRATRTTIVLLAVCAVVLVALQTALPGTALVAHGYAAPASEAASPTIAIDPTPNPPDPATSYYTTRKGISTRFRLLVHLPPETSLSEEATRYTLTAPDGFTWSSPWLTENGIVSTNPTSTASASARTDVGLQLPRPIYDRLASTPVSLRIELLATTLHDTAPVTLTLTRQFQAVPGLGLCAVGTGFGFQNVICRAPFGQIPFFRATTTRTAGPCTDPTQPTDPARPPALVRAAGSIGTVYARSLQPAISSVTSAYLNLFSPGDEGRFSPGDEGRHGGFCPAFDVTFQGHTPEARLHLETAPVTISLKEHLNQPLP
jgi:hypothetical protein